VPWSAVVHGVLCALAIADCQYPASNLGKLVTIDRLSHKSNRVCTWCDITSKKEQSHQAVGCSSAERSYLRDLLEWLRSSCVELLHGAVAVVLKFTKGAWSKTCGRSVFLPQDLHSNGA